MQQVECIIFDCDNVLVDTETIMVSVMLQMAKPYGATMALEEAVRLFSGRQILQTIMLLEEHCGTVFPDDFEQQFREKAYAEFRKGVKAIPGVKDLLLSLKLPFCVASSGPREKIELNLGIAGLLHFFDSERIFSSYEINSWKPDPGIFLYAAKSMGYAPAECVVVEDSLAGVEAAVKGGFRVYGLTNGNNRQELNDKGATVFEEMSQLSTLLKLNSRF